MLYSHQVATLNKRTHMSLLGRPQENPQRAVPDAGRGMAENEVTQGY
jgi:hypothetical protein